VRRILGLSVAVTLALGMIVSPAVGSSAVAADDFSNGRYDGSTGNLPWDGPWIEVGENDGPGDGGVQVQSGSLCSGECLTSTALIGLTQQLGARRAVPLDAAESASLEYRLKYPTPPLTTDPVRVEASVNGGAWKQLATHAAPTDGTFTSILPVGGVVDIRFSSSGLALGASWGVDDVEIEVTLPSTTTTTTSTLPTITVPTVPTVPTLLTTTTVAVPTTISLPGDSTSTTSVDGNSTTIRTGPAPSSATTTTTDSNRDRISNRPTTTTTMTRGVDDDTTRIGELQPPPAVDPRSTALELPVVREIDPGLAPQSMSASSREVQTDLLSQFLISSEDIVFDLLANAALGIVLCWVSIRRFPPNDR